MLRRRLGSGCTRSGSTSSGPTLTTGVPRDVRDPPSLILRTQTPVSKRRRRAMIRPAPKAHSWLRLQMHRSDRLYLAAATGSSSRSTIRGSSRRTTRCQKISCALMRCASDDAITLPWQLKLVLGASAAAKIVCRSHGGKPGCVIADIAVMCAAGSAALFLRPHVHAFRAAGLTPSLASIQ